MSNREFEFLTGIESSVAPDPGTPTNDEDAISLGWITEHGWSRDGLHGPVADINALKAITAAVRQDKHLCYVESKTAIYAFDAQSGATGDDDEVVEPDAGTGRWLKTSGGAGGAGGQFENAYAAEKIDTSSNPKAVALSQKQCVEFVAPLWIDLNEGSGEISIEVIDISDNTIWLVHDFNVAENNPGETDYDLAQKIEDELNNHGSTTLTYTVSYTQTTRKFSVAASGAFTLLLKTGTHGADNTDTGLLKEIGYDDSSDTGSTTSHDADNTIEDSEGYIKKAFATKTDADLLVKSRNYSGIVDATTNKVTTATVKINAEVSGYSSLSQGAQYYTLGSSITIDATNNKIDFDEGGGELTATISSGIYYRGHDSNPAGYQELCADIKAQMDAAGGTYRVYFDKNESKFTIEETGGPTSHTLKWGTGTNSATCAALELGWAKSDTASATSHTSTSTVDKAGEVGLISDSLIKEKSVFSGFTTNDENLFSEKNFTISDYDSTYSIPSDWLSTSREHDQGEEIQLHDQHVNTAGYGVRVFHTTASGQNYIIQYKTPSSGWTTAATSIPVRIAGSSTDILENFNGNYYQRARCIVGDKRNHGVIALIRHTGTYFEVHEYHSTDLDNWTGSGIRKLSRNYYVGNIDVREDKAVILTNDDTSAFSGFHISTNSGSGFATWGGVVGLTNDLIYNSPSIVAIQYWPGEVSPSDYRIIVAGTKLSDTDVYVAHFKGDGTSETIVKPFGTDNRFVDSGTLDEAGTGNRFLLTAIETSAGTILDVALSNDSASSFTMSDKGDANNGGSNIDLYNGYTAANITRHCWNDGLKDRAVLHGDYMFIVAGTESRSGNSATTLLRSTDAGSSWETPQDIGDTSGTTPNDGEYCIRYIPSIHGCVVAWKKIDGARSSDNLTEGQIYSRLFQILSNGSISLYDIEQIDGGEGMANFQGFTVLDTSADKGFCSWEHYDSVLTYDVLWYNLFA